MKAMRPSTTEHRASSTGALAGDYHTKLPQLIRTKIWLVLRSNDGIVYAR
jgi:hypothetical protein